MLRRTKCCMNSKWTYFAALFAITSNSLRWTFLFHGWLFANNISRTFGILPSSNLLLFICLDHKTSSWMDLHTKNCIYLVFIQLYKDNMLYEFKLKRNPYVTSSEIKTAVHVQSLSQYHDENLQKTLLWFHCYENIMMFTSMSNVCFKWIENI